jgi:anti-sigma regulatory factor (Ser/Thr protein kinase)
MAFTFHRVHTGHFRSYRVRFVHGRGGVQMEVATPGMLVLPYTASSVGVARRRLISDLTRAGVREGAACDAGLVISELISNALRHATPLPGNSVRVSWDLREGSVTVAVSDGGAGTVPRVHRPAGSSLGGRGLGIVDRLSTQWGVRAGHGDAQDGTDDGHEDGTASDGQASDAAPAARAAAGAGDRGGHGTGPQTGSAETGSAETTVWAEVPVEYATVPALAGAPGVIASPREA